MSRLPLSQNAKVWPIVVPANTRGYLNKISLFAMETRLSVRLQFNARSGAIAIGARNFLVAYNINLNTTSVRRANSIAFDIREAGSDFKREGDPLTGKVITDEKGEPVRIPGSLKKVRAIGWFIKEYSMAQISMNLTDIYGNPYLMLLLTRFAKRQDERGLRVTGSELIGLVPLSCMLEAGRYFLHKQKRSSGIPDEEIIEMAVHSLGLNELAPFDPQKADHRIPADGGAERSVG